MNKFPSVSDSEWLIMKVLWSKSPLTANEIVDGLYDKVKSKPKTVKTLIGRLVAKGAVGIDQSSRAFLYYPLITESECTVAESKSFIKKVYGGAVKLMVANILEENDLSKEDIEELKEILKKKSHE